MEVARPNGLEHCSDAELVRRLVAGNQDAMGVIFDRYYRLVRRFSGLTFDPAEVARTELRYWVVHRELSGGDDHTALVDVLADLHSATFDISQERAHESADWRAKAAITVDGITGRRSTDLVGDWHLLEDQLGRCYRSLAREIAV